MADLIPISFENFPVHLQLFWPSSTSLGGARARLPLELHACAWEKEGLFLSCNQALGTYHSFLFHPAVCLLISTSKLVWDTL